MDGRMDRKNIKMDGWMDKKQMDGWMDGQKKRKKRWMVGRIKI